MSGIPLSRSQQNMYNGVVQDGDSSLYLIGKSYRFQTIAVSEFLAALSDMVSNNPIQLCVLEESGEPDVYPNLFRRLNFDDIVVVLPDGESAVDDGSVELLHMWSSGILEKPLVRYVVRINDSGEVVGLDAYCHHVLLDGGSTAAIEADLGRYLAGRGGREKTSVGDALARVAEAHRRETAKADEAATRFADQVQREISDAVLLGGFAEDVAHSSVTAARGVLQESVAISGKAFEELLSLAEEKQLPLNIVVAAAAVAVQASLRQTTACLLVHAVDNRFGDPELDVATCLVNSVAHPVWFPPYASVNDVVRALDRDYVRAARRRWLREEQYRRMYLAINKTPHIDGLTFNFIRQSCAPELRPFLSESPVATNIGPVEGMTVACLLDEEDRRLDVAIWNRADLVEVVPQPWIAERIAAALGSMRAMWDQPIAMIVNEWFGVDAEGKRSSGSGVMRTENPVAPAWFLHAGTAIGEFLTRRRHVDPWLAWLVQNEAMPGEVLVFIDDRTDKTVDLLVACHLAGCGYSVCDSSDEIQLRADSIAGKEDKISVRMIDVAATQLDDAIDSHGRALIDARLGAVARDQDTASRIAYVMPTSGSTGSPKLVQISHGSLARFCAAVSVAYGWKSTDTLLQCAPLTSDISVEEIFGSAFSGCTVVRSAAMAAGDLQELVGDLNAAAPTLVDLPTAVWHLLCEDDVTLGEIYRSSLRQVVIGGEAIRPSVIDKWVDSGAAQRISLVSTYGPTEATVVVTHLRISCEETEPNSVTHLRLGRPLVPNTVFIAFGEVVVVGDVVSSGYLGLQNRSFGAVSALDGGSRRAFATADRVICDEDDFPVFHGRRDAIVKISGKRVDTAAVVRVIAENPAVTDVGVEVHNGSLGVWFQTQRTHDGEEDAPVASDIRRLLAQMGVSSFVVVGVPRIPRKPNGKVDSTNLRSMPEFVDAMPDEAETNARAGTLAKIWARHLGRPIAPDTSLLAEGIGSLDLIKILPDTRAYLGRQITILDLISADSAAALVAVSVGSDVLESFGATVEIADDVEALWLRRPAQVYPAPSHPSLDGAEPIVVVGASGILGAGFAQAIRELKQAHSLSADVVLVARADLPAQDPWATLKAMPGVDIHYLRPGYDRRELEELMHRTGARTLVNCVGNTNMLAPYRGLRAANVELVSAAVHACVANAARLIHLSTFVVNADALVPCVTDPREAAYPYAASKSLAELIVTGSVDELDFSLVRLPRVLGTAYQMRDSADILVSIVDACIALGSYPSVELTEEVTTGQVAAQAVLGLLSTANRLGRSVAVVRGAQVDYAQLLSEYGGERVDLPEWKLSLDQSDWARQNPARWAVIDAWVALGMRLDSRTYAEYLADRQTIALDINSVIELAAIPGSIRDLLPQPVLL
nr:AMP-binding protein [Mycobacteroides salmoniphilum]